MKKLIPIFIMFTISISLLAQVPKGFSYQAIARDYNNQILENTTMNIRIGILSDTINPVIVWEEEHTVNTNSFGLFTITIGDPSAPKTDGNAASFSDIDWSGSPLFIRTKVDNGGWYDMGSAQLWSVPYAMISGESYKDISSPFLFNNDTVYIMENLSVGSDSPMNAKFSVTGNDYLSEDALFEVKRSDGQTVFAVYNEGVRVYVPADPLTKGPKGGFAIGGFDRTKGAITEEYMYVTSDSIRMYIDKTPGGKGPKGGFAIGGFDRTKNIVDDYIVVNADSTRIYIDDSNLKGPKGGFAIGGFDRTKADRQDYMKITQDSTRFYIDNTNAKGPKGGFAIGGFDRTKGNGISYFDVATDTTGIINPSQNRVSWYPLKNAFITGKVLVESPDSVGTNSMATGFESKSIGDYSQALGYKAIARDDYSTAIGKNAVAYAENSVSIGNHSRADKISSFALGTGAIAFGKNSYAIGSSGVDSAGVPTGNTMSIGEQSFAIGMGAEATGYGSFSVGIGSNSDGNFSFAGGYKNVSTGYGSIALGYLNKAEGYYSTALGYSSTATGFASVAMGQGSSSTGNNSVALGNSYSKGDFSFAAGLMSSADGFSSTAIGHEVSARAYNSFVIGRYNTLWGTDDEWIDYEPLFVIGNGDLSTGNRSDALTVLKNGKMGINTIPWRTLDVITKNINTQEAIMHLGELRNEGGYFASFSRSDLFISGGTDITLGLYIARDVAASSVRFLNGYTYFANNSGLSLNGSFTPTTSMTINPDGKVIVGTKTLAALQDGNVGIGTTAPTHKLHVKGTTTNDAKILLEPLTWNDNSDFCELLFGDINHAIGCAFGTGMTFYDVNRFYFGGGNVGIGIPDPASMLSVYANNPGKYAVQIQNDGNSYTSHGMKISCGYDGTTSNTTYAITFLDGNHDWLGSISIKDHTVHYNTSSDRRLKTNIAETHLKGIELVNKIPVVDFSFKDSPDKTLTGFIAQDVLDIVPDAVSQNEEGFYQLSYPALIPLLTKAIQEQQELIVEKNKKIESLEERLAKIESLLGIDNPK